MTKLGDENPILRYSMISSLHIYETSNERNVKLFESIQLLGTCNYRCMVHCYPNRLLPRSFSFEIHYYGIYFPGQVKQASLCIVRFARRL